MQESKTCFALVIAKRALGMYFAIVVGVIGREPMALFRKREHDDTQTRAVITFFLNLSYDKITGSSQLGSRPTIRLF